MLDLKSLVPWGQKNSNLPARSAKHYDPFNTLRSEFDRVFEDFFRGGTALAGFDKLSNEAIIPQIDVCETDKEMVVAAEIPGVDEKDVEVTLSGDVLTIRGEKKFEREDNNDNRKYVERYFGSFNRSMRLPFEAGEEDVAADIKNGVLTVTIPKPKNCQREAKRIEVRQAA